MQEPTVTIDNNVETELNPLPRSATPLPEDAGKIVHRSFDIGDLHFLTNSWNKSYRKYRSGISDEDYYLGQDALIYALSSRSNIIIACDEKEPFYIYGWACGKLGDDDKTLILHYVYVKQAYRCRRIASTLVHGLGYRKGADIVATHWTGPVKHISQRYNMRFNPYLLNIGNQNV